MRNVMQVASNALRGLLVAPQGRKLVISDLSNIEGRGLAWEAGEQWKLAAFAAYDAGIGPDLYKLAYARSFTVKPDSVDKEQRQIGKVMELSMGYEGGVGAFVNMAAVYGLKLDKLAAAAVATTPAEVLAESARTWEWATKQRRTFDLPRDQYMVCDALKRLWRAAHPATTALWEQLAAGVRGAIAAPGTTHRAGPHVQIIRTGNWLRIRLPSGRSLCYPSPRLHEDESISYMGMNQYSRVWSRLKTYGGKLAENITQAIARDVLAAAMPAIEAAGYRIVLTVHDEVITEAPDSDQFNADHLSSLLATNPSWAPGLPLAAAGFDGYRYRKD